MMAGRQPGLVLSDRVRKCCEAFLLGSRREAPKGNRRARGPRLFARAYDSAAPHRKCAPVPLRWKHLVWLLHGGVKDVITKATVWHGSRGGRICRVDARCFHGHSRSFSPERFVFLGLIPGIAGIARQFEPQF